MELAVILPLLIKMGCAAMVVVLASLAVERVGPVIGALIATLPVAGGPAYIFLAMEHGPAFIAASTVAGFPSLIGQALYQVAYVHIAQRRGTVVSLCASLSVWLCATMSVRATGWGFAVLAPLTFAGFVAAHLWVRRHIAWTGGTAPVRRWFDLPVRAGAVMVVSGSVIPRRSGRDDAHGVHQPYCHSATTDRGEEHRGGGWEWADRDGWIYGWADVPASGRHSAGECAGAVWGAWGLRRVECVAVGVAEAAGAVMTNRVRSLSDDRAAGVCDILGLKRG